MRDCIIGLKKKVKKSDPAQRMYKASVNEAKKNESNEGKESDQRRHKKRKDGPFKPSTAGLSFPCYLHPNSMSSTD